MRYLPVHLSPSVCIYKPPLPVYLVSCVVLSSPQLAVRQSLSAHCYGEGYDHLLHLDLALTSGFYLPIQKKWDKRYERYGIYTFCYKLVFMKLKVLLKIIDLM